MIKTCLTCKYEPEWGEIIGAEYPRRSGLCRYPVKINKLPRSWYPARQNNIIRYDDDSGVYDDCECWKTQED